MSTVNPRVRRVLAVIALECPIALVIVFSWFGPTEWPTPMLPYVAATLVLAPVAVVVTERLFRRRP